MSPMNGSLYRIPGQNVSTRFVHAFQQRARLLLLGVIVLALEGCAGMPSGGASAPLPPRAGSDSFIARQLRPVFERYEGTPYRWGGVSAKGFDCSGFIVTAYREALDRQLPRTTDQMLASGKFVRRDRIQPGDVIFFHIAGKDQHAGIYMGNYQFIHASTSSGVIQSALDARYWRNRYSQARRFINQRDNSNADK